jgi:DNA polymerase III sliding clamp (beta) subunit (PCNA family)
MLNKQDLQIYKVASKDRTRPAITGVLVQPAERDGQHGIVLAATDGYRLTEKFVETDFEPDFESMIIPAKTLEMVAKLLDKRHRVLISQTQFKIMRMDDEIPEGILERTLTIGATIDAEFPEYVSLIPTDDVQTAVQVDVKYLIEALKQCEDKKVILEVRNLTSPVVLKDVDAYDRSVVSVVMPLKQSD